MERGAITGASIVGDDSRKQEVPGVSEGMGRAQLERRRNDNIEASIRSGSNIME